MTLLQSKQQEAVELSLVWASYLPDSVETTHWRLLLDLYSKAVITKAVRRCAQKRMTLKGNITLEQMLSFIESVCYRETQEKS